MSPIGHYHGNLNWDNTNVARLKKVGDKKLHFAQMFISMLTILREGYPIPIYEKSDSRRKL